MRFHDPKLASERRHILDQLIARMRSYPWSDVPCVVCGEGERLDVALEKWGITMKRCEVCDHLFTSPRMPEHAVPELYGSFYWEQYQVAIGSPSIQERLAFDSGNGHLKLRRDVLPHRGSGRLLDVGASSGGLVKQASDMGFDAAGLEPSPEICTLARRAHGVTMYCGTLAEQEFADGAFDVITLHDVLEHMFEPVREIREMRRVLAPGGLVAIETPTSLSRNHADQGVEWTTISPLEHVHVFNEANAERILVDNGFRVVDLYSPNEDNWIAVGEAA
jgi:SAM-dependent methyltransferase